MAKNNLFSITSQIEALLQSYDIKYQNIELYKQSLVHNSFAHEQGNIANYQRLEFLGDAMLGLIIATYLYKNFQTATEGEITRYRSNLVRRDTLAQITRHIGLDKLILVGHGEMLNPGEIREGICADVYESFLAAIYLDVNYEAAFKFVEKSLLGFAKKHNRITQNQNYKNQLQEDLQADTNLTLKYRIKKKFIENGVVMYEVAAVFDNVIYGVGVGASKKLAMKLAAQNALSKKVLSKPQPSQKN